jgi:hypothetical protein
MILASSYRPFCTPFKFMSLDFFVFVFFLYDSNPILYEATLMPESETSLEKDRMLRDHKGLVNFGNIINLFQQLNSIDDHVESRFR